MINATLESIEPLFTDSVRQRMERLGQLAARAWLNRSKLDQLLLRGIGNLENCHLLYAVDNHGRQVSSNVYCDHIDGSPFRQLLQNRPYSKLAEESTGFALSNLYISMATEQPCLTAVYAVGLEQGQIGFIAADFHQGAVQQFEKTHQADGEHPSDKSSLQ